MTPTVSPTTLMPRALPAALAALAVTTLAGCVVAPPAYYANSPQPLPSSMILSRLPADHPASANMPAKPLSAAERKRYADIDKQVMRDQDQAMRDEAAARAAANAWNSNVTVYGGWYPGWYGAYYYPRGAYGGWDGWRYSAYGWEYGGSWGVPYSSSVWFSF